VFDRAQGAKTRRDAGMFNLPSCLYIVMAQATVTASTRLEKTQKVALGNLPVVYSLVMTFSCT